MRSFPTLLVSSAAVLLLACGIETEGSLDGAPPVGQGGSVNLGGAGQAGSINIAGNSASGQGGSDASGKGGSAGSSAGKGGSSGSGGDGGSGGDSGKGGTGGKGGAGGKGGTGGKGGSAGAGGKGGTGGASGKGGTGGKGGVSGSSGQGGAGSGQGGAGPACGNGVKEDSEACDGSDFGDNSSCETALGPGAKGTLFCEPDCTLNTTACTLCGNAAIDPGEECDGSNLGDKSCSDAVNGSPGGTLGCKPDCSFDTSQCQAAPSCGNGALDDGEECDGSSNLPLPPCSDVISQTGVVGTVTCSGQCKLDTSQCAYCGDSKKNNAEACDGPDIDGATCESLHPGTGAQGQVACAADCTFVEGCTYCGDGKINNSEQCDGNELNGATCPSGIGSMACNPDCTLSEQNCQTASCSDGAKNGSETDVDCGGSCPKCENDLSCSVPADCQSGICAGNICSAPSCNDGLKNGKETDIDCGGSDCPKCADTLACAGANDCQSNVCVSQVCQAPTCVDAQTNGSESDKDCGGSCDLCILGKKCNVASDCTSASCDGGACKDAPTCTTQSACGGDNCIGGRCFAPGAEVHSGAPTGTCPAGWKQIGNYGCFLRVDQGANWYGAFKECRRLGGNLATLDTQAELDAVGGPSGVNLSSSVRVWVGLVCKGNGSACNVTSNWSWLDGAPVDTNGWTGSNPDANEFCGSIRRPNSSVVYGNDACSQSYAYLCERPL